MFGLALGTVIDPLPVPVPRSKLKFCQECKWGCGHRTGSQQHRSHCAVTVFPFKYHLGTSYSAFIMCQALG